MACFNQMRHVLTPQTGYEAASNSNKSYKIYPTTQIMRLKNAIDKHRS